MVVCFALELLEALEAAGGCECAEGPAFIVDSYGDGPAKD